MILHGCVEPNAIGDILEPTDTSPPSITITVIDILSAISEITVSAVDAESVVDSVSIRLDGTTTTRSGSTLTISLDPAVLGPGLHVYDGAAYSAGGQDWTAQISFSVPP